MFCTAVLPHARKIENTFNQAPPSLPPLAVGRRSLGRRIRLPAVLLRWLVGIRRRLELDALLLLTIVSIVLVELLARALWVNGRGCAVLRRWRLVLVRRCGSGSHPTGTSERWNSIATATARVTSKKKQGQDEDDNNDSGKDPSSPIVPPRAIVANAYTSAIWVITIATPELSRVERGCFLEWCHLICSVCHSSILCPCS